MIEEGSTTGRWSMPMTQQSWSRAMREVGKRHTFPMEFDTENRILRRMAMLKHLMAGRRHKMKRASDRNANAKLRFGQATMLGWLFEVQVAGFANWGSLKELRRHWAVSAAGNRLGPYKTRHRAVVAALQSMGLEA